MGALPQRARRLLVLSVVSVVPGACTMVGGVPPAPAPVPSAPAAAPTSAEPAPPRAAPATPAVATRVVRTALENIGTPYAWGGTNANGFDCSGLIQYAYGRFGIRIPRTSASQMRAGRAVVPDPGGLRPGDVLGFSAPRSSKTSHVGLYIGGDEFIHSSSSGVRISSLRNPYWQENLVGARRIVE